ncbi:hypothetical protein A4V11_09385 [Pediococcus acidilactici]|nr:hypothetical protein [Pediococcus acidilactici]AOW75228.1 hypothetical protein A4V11_09385 [Pediococcus acidilactici]
MIGGMVPPLGIAIATSFFQKKFTLQERKAGKANYVLGAIPFAAGDPLHTIPANIIGTGIGGALCMASGITLQAPHGGVFVIPIACNHPLIYTGCIVLRVVITAIIRGLTRKTLSEDQINKQMAGGII